MYTCMITWLLLYIPDAVIEFIKLVLFTVVYVSSINAIMISNLVAVFRHFRKG